MMITFRQPPLTAFDATPLMLFIFAFHYATFHWWHFRMYILRLAGIEISPLATFRWYWAPLFAEKPFSAAIIAEAAISHFRLAARLRQRHTLSLSFRRWLKLIAGHSEAASWWCRAAAAFFEGWFSDIAAAAASAISRHFFSPFISRRHRLSAATSCAITPIRDADAGFIFHFHWHYAGRISILTLRHISAAAIDATLADIRRVFWPFSPQIFRQPPFHAFRDASLIFADTLTPDATPHADAIFAAFRPMPGFRWDYWCHAASEHWAPMLTLHIELSATLLAGWLLSAADADIAAADIDTPPRWCHFRRRHYWLIFDIADFRGQAFQMPCCFTLSLPHISAPTLPVSSPLITDGLSPPRAITDADFHFSAFDIAFAIDTLRRHYSALPPATLFSWSAISWWLSAIFASLARLKLMLYVSCRHYWQSADYRARWAASQMPCWADIHTYIYIYFRRLTRRQLPPAAELSGCQELLASALFSPQLSPDGALIEGQLSIDFFAASFR